MRDKPTHLSAEHIIRAYEMLTPEQVAEYKAKIHPEDAPILFPCPPQCPTSNA